MHSETGNTSNPEPQYVPRILLAGGQCSGKSEMMEELRRHFGTEVLCVPEVSSLLREYMGIRPNVEDADEIREFQYRLFRIQKECESLADITAFRRGQRAVVLDRGTLCGAVYLPGGYEEWRRLCGTTRDREYRRYDLVLYHEQAGKETYNQRAEQKEFRPSAFPIAVERAHGLGALWQDHTRFLFIPYSQDWDEKRKAVIAAIRTFLKEIPLTTQMAVPGSRSSGGALSGSKAG